MEKTYTNLNSNDTDTDTDSDSDTNLNSNDTDTVKIIKDNFRKHINPTNQDIEPTKTTSNVDIMNATPTQINTTNIAILGCGGCGTNLVLELVNEVNTSNVSYICLNSDKDHLSTVNNPSIQTILFGQGQGAGMNPDKGKKYFDESNTFESELSPLIQDKDMVIILCGMGGGSGMGSALSIADQLKTKNKLVMLLALMPFDYEGEEKMDIALEWMDKFTAIDYLNYDFVCSQLIYDQHKSNANLTKAQIRNAATMTVVECVEAIHSITTKTGEENIDFADIKAVLTGGRALVLTGNSKTLTQTTQNALDMVHYRENTQVDNFGGILLNIESKQETNMQELSDTVARFKSPNGYQKFKDANVATDSGTITLNIILGGQPKPKTQRVEAKKPMSTRERVARLIKK